MDAMSNITGVAAASSLYLCALCDKPFTKELQYKRHTVYCRKSQGKKRVPSCQACKKSKIKCNFGTPCNQCLRKGITCSFDGNKRKDGRKDDLAPLVLGPHSTATSVLPLDLVVDPEPEVVGGEFISDQSSGDFFDDNADTFGIFSSSKDSPDTNGFYLDHSTGEIRLSARRNSFSKNDMLAPALPVEENSWIALFNDSHYNMATQNIFAGINSQLDELYGTGKQVQITSEPDPRSIIPQRVTIPQTIAIPSEIIPSRNFTKNVAKFSEQETYITLILDMIYAYPRMMTRRETFPPFMHPLSPADDSGSDKLPQYLTNCMGIAQLFLARTDDTRSFVWATIRAEIKGIRTRRQAFDRYDTLSAMQAILLYFIMRAMEQTPQGVIDDFEMLVAYEEVVQRSLELANGVCLFLPYDSPQGEACLLPWRDWIYVESITRIQCIWLMLSRVYYMKTGRPCFVSDHYRELPLPCTKNEWEAQSESQWRQEHQRVLRSNTPTLKSVGDLADAQKRIPGCPLYEKLSVWNAGIDNLGMVLNLTVCLV